MRFLCGSITFARPPQPQIALIEQASVKQGVYRHWENMANDTKNSLQEKVWGFSLKSCGSG